MYSVCYTPDGSAVLAGGNSKYLCIYDCAGTALLKRFQLTRNRTLDGQPSPSPPPSPPLIQHLAPATAFSLLTPITLLPDTYAKPHTPALCQFRHAFSGTAPEDGTLTFFVVSLCVWLLLLPCLACPGVLDFLNSRNMDPEAGPLDQIDADPDDLDADDDIEAKSAPRAHAHTQPHPSRTAHLSFPVLCSAALGKGGN